MVYFQDIPEEVVNGHLLRFMKLGDILRFRRVCRSTKTLVDEFLRVGKFENHGDAPVEVEINEEDKSLANLLSLQLTIPATHFYINNTKGKAFFEDPEIPTFLEKFGKQITHLRVREFFILTPDTQEMKFYECFPNLTSLELEQIDLTIGKDEPKPFTFPVNFRNIKRLKLNALRIPGEPSSVSDLGYAVDLMQFCDKLDYICEPHFFIDNDDPGPFNIEADLNWVSQIIVKRAREDPTAPNLKYYDLQNFKVDVPSFEGQIFAELLENCRQFGVKLLNADALMFFNVEEYFQGHLADIFVPLVSLRNLHATNYDFEAPDLEKLVIEGTSLCSFEVYNGSPRWPKLQTLDITVDSEYLANRAEIEMDFDYDYEDEEEQATSDLMEFIFPENSVRSNLVDLTLHFSENVSKSELYRFKAEQIIRPCPFLTRLKITNWPGTNKILSLLWSSLHHLEEVYLGNCKKLGNSAFVGENTTDPTFLKLKGLKKLSLEGLEKMPKITDTVFRLVFCHLKLTCLYFKSSKPIKNVTMNGIRALQTGEFANSIEKFPFKDWSLTEVSEEDFKQLESEFRSSQMI